MVLYWSTFNFRHTIGYLNKPLEITDYVITQRIGTIQDSLPAFVELLIKSLELGDHIGGHIEFVAAVKLITII